MNKEDLLALLKAEAEAVLNIPVSGNYEKAVELIHEAVHVNHGKLVATGMGKAGQVALNIATTLSSSGTPAVFLHASEAQHGDLGVIQENDILLLISNSGRTREVLEMLDLARHLYENIKFIVITGIAESPLAKATDVVLLTGHPDEICPLGMTPTTSTTTMTVIGDLLVVMMMKKINFTMDQYAKRHHGGYLGQKSRDGSGLK
jgi:arabinose-5-phosphate isomerase